MTDLQWSIDAYTVVIASFLMFAGSMADRLGRRRVFQTGLAVFSLGSLLCSLSPNLGALVGFRVVQALGGAMLNPVAMSIIVNTFTDPRDRARAIGTWGAVFGISMALGPLLGGVLVEAVGWRSIFWINVPVALAAIALTAKFVPESRAATTRRVDPIGQILVVILLGALTSALIEGPLAGWRSPWIVGGFAAAIAAVVTFVVYERRRAEPLVDIRFFRSWPFSAATALAVIAFAAFNGFLFLSSLYLQDTRGLPPADAGACMLPIAVALVVFAPMSGRLVGAGHARWALVGAGTAITIAALLLTSMTVATPLVRLIGAFAIFGIGLGLVNTPITNAAVSGMPRAQAGFASALASTSRQVGSALGVAIAGTIAGATAPRDAAFATAIQPFVWIVVCSGVAIAGIGIVSTGERARATVRSVASLVD
jgi:EmrB/QacA subfamily drug resistance transporter